MREPGRNDPQDGGRIVTCDSVAIIGGQRVSCNRPTDHDLVETTAQTHWHHDPSHVEWVFTRTWGTPTIATARVPDPETGMHWCKFVDRCPSPDVPHVHRRNLWIENAVRELVQWEAKELDAHYARLL